MKSTHLPKEQSQRAQLIKLLQQKLQQLNQTNAQQQSNNQMMPISNKNQRQILKLRIKLIGDCSELSVQRIQHLQQIFKHYCTHIFKIGKHMTFQRLQYEKVHLTLDRLCVLLKDFGLNCANIDGVEKQIIDKQQIVRNFKRISKNCRDLSFEQFIALIQKLAIVYFDQKLIFQQKNKKNRQQRQFRIAEYKKKMKQKKRQQQQRLKILNQSPQINKQNQQNQQNVGAQPDEHQQHEQKDEKNENDDLIQKMMEDDKIQNPNDEIKKAAGLEAQKSLKTNKKKVLKMQQKQSHLQLTPQQKIQYYYQIIGVDNVHDFRKKMSQLGLPLFKQYQSHVKPQHKRSTSTKTGSQIVKVVIQGNQQQQERRLIQLRQKINIKRQRDKHLYTPTMTKQQYEQRKKKRQDKQQQIMKQMNISKIGTQYSTNAKQKQREKQKKKIQLMDKQLSLDMLNHISFEDLKNKFDPKKFVHSDQSDKIYLNEYGAQVDGSNHIGNRKKAQSNSRIQVGTNKSGIRQNTGMILQRKRTSSNIVQDFKKRAYEMQVKQFHKQAQFSRFVNQMKKKQKNMRNQPLI